MGESDNLIDNPSAEVGTAFKPATVIAKGEPLPERVTHSETFGQVSTKHVERVPMSEWDAPQWSEWLTYQLAQPQSREAFENMKAVKVALDRYTATLESFAGWWNKRRDDLSTLEGRSALGESGE